ncbi:Efflux pump azaK [Cladobotryum mycophilum]|uniref:Efflux pump azaK n=1 Tax=Cladobotryum mycophilum TaxID=491253 RepID=A0ABR0SR26_9HYPO
MSPLSLRSESSSSSEHTLHNDNGSNIISSESTETTPLISGKSDEPESYVNASSSQVEDGVLPAIKAAQASKALPKLQIFLLCFARTMEPIAFFAIFPFIAQMVQRNGHLADSDVGFYSGLIESLFSVVQVFVFIFWGRLADSIGRKPVMIITLIGMIIWTMAYTMATTIPQMILFRCLAGVFSGSRLVMRTMLFEHCTPENEAIAYSWFAFANNIGTCLGPLIGGVLADPVAQYPEIFKGITFFENFPYALVGIVLTAVGITGVVVTFLFLEETLKSDDETVSSTSGSKAAAHKDLSILELLMAPKVAITIWVYTHFMLLAFAFTAIMPVFLFTPITIGGVGFSPSQISAFMAVQGASQALWLILAFPILQGRYGTKNLLKICATAYQFFLAGIILLNLFLRIGTKSAMAWAWTLGSLIAIIGPGVSMGFTSAQLAINDASPSPHIIATLNGLSMTCASVIRSFVPGVSTVIFAVGIRSQILWGYLAWVILIPLAIALRICINYIPESRRVPRDE